mgnify:FL=1
MIDFAYPWLLLLLLLVPLIAYYCVFRQKQPSVTVSTVEPFATVRAVRRPGFPLSCMLLALCVLIVALARPRAGNEKFLIRSQGIDIVLAIDLSGSMASFDVPRNITSGRDLVNAIEGGQLKNRLEVAKEEIAKFIAERPNDRIGLIGFADVAYNLAPPTLDHSWLLAHLANLKPGILGEMTGIASPIGTGVSRLRNSDAPRRVLVLFTDGSNTARNSLTPEQAAELAKKFDIIIHTVGIGSSNAFAIDRGQIFQVEDQFDEKLLRSLAEITAGKYFRAADADGMKQVMDEINQLEKTTVEQPRYMEYREYAPQLALAALALLMLAFLAQSTWKLRLP